MASTLRSLSEKAIQAENDELERQSLLTYRHWFVISLLFMFNVTVFGFIFLVLLGKIRWGM